MNYSYGAAQVLLQKAEAKYKSAELLFNNDLLDSTISELYYSAFQTVCALMVIEGLSVSKHTHVRSYVNKELGYKGLIPVELVKMYNKLMDSREEADYRPMIANDKDYCAELLSSVRQFTDKVREIIASKASD